MRSAIAATVPSADVVADAVVVEQRVVDVDEEDDSFGHGDILTQDDRAL